MVIIEDMRNYIKEAERVLGNKEYYKMYHSDSTETYKRLVSIHHILCLLGKTRSLVKSYVSMQDNFKICNIHSRDTFISKYFFEKCNGIKTFL